MKTKLLCLLLVILMMLSFGCKKEEEAPVEPTPAPTPAPAIVVVEQLPVHSDSWEDILDEEVAPPEESPGILSPTTGREVDAQRVFKPVFVCYDNACEGRPLAGILEADIVYEAPSLAKDGTRLLALFSDQSPARVGPVGEASQEYASVQKEWGGGMLLHTGYAGENKPADGDFTAPVTNAGEHAAYFFEPDDAKGVCADLEKLVPALFTAEPPEAGVRFLLAEGYGYEDADAAVKFRLPFGGEKGEKVEYVFDPEAGMYLRYQAAADGRMAGAQALSWNEETAALESVPLFVNSVIVQYVEEADGALTLIGSGACDFFTNGVRVKGTWTRESAEASTLYCLEDGSVVTMAVGRTWIALHPAKTAAQVF